MVSSKKPPLYDLCGIVYHYGSLTGGHYTSACKDSGNNWYKYNDQYVSLENNPANLVKNDAYVLVYQRKDIAGTGMSLEELKKVSTLSSVELDDFLKKHDLVYKDGSEY